MAKDLCSLNGEVLPRSKARIDPLDRGMVFGDALYEVVKVLEGRILHLESHLERLRSGLERIDIPVTPELDEACRELIAEAEVEGGSLYLQVTRGVAPRGHVPPDDLEPTILILPMSHDHAAHGSRTLTAISILDPRWAHCDLKTSSMMATVTGKLAMRDAKVDEVVFVGPSGDVREGGSTNLFVRHADRLETCPLDGRILPGVTRALLLGFAAELGLPVVERAPRIAERDGWQEALLCGTLTGVQPLVVFDQKAIGVEPGVGEWTRALGEALERYEAQLSRA